MSHENVYFSEVGCVSRRVLSAAKIHSFSSNDCKSYGELKLAFFADLGNTFNLTMYS